MSTSSPKRHARRSLIWLAVIHLVMIAVLVGGVVAGKTGALPKLALDLEGGTEMVLTPKLDDPSKKVTSEQLQQAVEIIRQRVDGTGVAETEVTTQNNQNIVVAMPGIPDEKTRNLIKSSAQMQFRPVITASQDITATPEKDLTPIKDIPKPKGKPQHGSDDAWVTPELFRQFQQWDCEAEMNKKERTTFKADEPAIACELDPPLQAKYLLGPVEVSGSDITDAEARPEQNSQGYTTGGWEVALTFNKKGADAFKTVTQRLTSSQPPKNQFAIVLDGRVVSAPQSLAVISDGRSSITGNFTQESAQELAEQLRYGALPMSFNIPTETQVSAKLGADQLKSGMIAGLIGLVLVAVYSFFQYRVLGLVTMASLIIMGTLTYLAIVLLGWGANYRLSLAGVAGLIVSIGLTADSFIVYFERIRDELREGRRLQQAIETGWNRARRTILASKAVNILAAVVLYFVAVGNVKGFAFTLGLTAVADIFVVFLFTHPMLQLLSRMRFFSEGHRMSGLDPRLLGAEPLYAGAGRVRVRRQTGDAQQDRKKDGKKGSGANREAQRRMTIAERRRAEELEARENTQGSESPKVEEN
ncbi:protein translocase subunit SecD [Pseudoglutamicibacter cumminsii]|uniref:Protein translocase subunit SecD n=1 Tax=Pseudoglutamicibacter cumminsii TaxID=156979 RepID=A0AAP4FCZ3_9MICC|nr:protein translocase subunit SecD [Pseudoglutamicibacter cumminsii]MDK6274196.1 protein translocase subunit SecD [Pseudoglutamicibacter cumminsii]